jgi:GATA-binding protein
MSGAAQYGERGGLLQRTHALSNSLNASGEAQSNTSSSSTTSITEHDFRFPRRPTNWHQGSSANTATSQSSIIKQNLGASALDKLDTTTADSVVRKELLRESFFPTWKDDTAGEELDSPDEMQKKDPLATQIWRLYSKAKKQLPNQERMENLTWRMMAMSLRKRKREDAARYVLNKMWLEVTLSDFS